MRQRHIKNLESKLCSHSNLIIENPCEFRGKWAEEFKADKINLEIGTGKGKFISTIASQHPDQFYIGVEGNPNAALRALEKCSEANLDNVRFILDYAADLSDWFLDAELDHIYLNFSDPHPKTRTKKKRLTYRDRLLNYILVLKERGEIEFKTDNDQLFEWTIDEIRASDLQIKYITRDLSSEDVPNIITEYEEKFGSKGFKIKKVIFTSRSKYMTNPISLAAYNGRDIPSEDRVFAASQRAKALESKLGPANVINATIGSLLDDEGQLSVLPTVEQMIHKLSIQDYAEYAPIAGTEGFRKAIVKAALRDYETDRFIAAIATPGGTGSIRNTISNYSAPGDKILTHNWHWAPYTSIAGEMGRTLEYFNLLNSNREFDLEDFEYKLSKLLKSQEHLVIILNTPANNPTGYSIDDKTWSDIVDILNKVSDDKKIALLVDLAYIDFAGNSLETRSFLRYLDKLKTNILPVLAYSASKSFSLYGFRCAGMIALAPCKELADEFIKVNTYSSRASWSNSPRAPQVLIERILNNDEVLIQVEQERQELRDLLYRRGTAFNQAALQYDLPILPYDSGFFITLPIEAPLDLSQRLEKNNVFVVAINGGIRISIASINEEKCARLPGIISNALSSSN